MTHARGLTFSTTTFKEDQRLEGTRGGFGVSTLAAAIKDVNPGL